MKEARVPKNRDVSFSNLSIHFLTCTHTESTVNAVSLINDIIAHQVTYMYL